MLYCCVSPTIHLSSPVTVTSHPQWHTSCSLKRCCHQRSPVTAVSPTIHFGTEWMTFEMALASEITRCCSITNHPSRSMHTVNGLWNGVARDDRINHSVLPTSPSCAQWTCCIMPELHCRFTTRQLTHTPWSAGMTVTPLRVCAPSPLPSSGTLCCWLKQTVSVANPHPPDGRLQDAVHSPTSVHTTRVSQSGRWAEESGRLHFQWPIHIHRMAGCRMPCTPLQVCTPPQLPNPGHWCWAEDSLANSIVSSNSLAAKWCSEHTIATLQNPGLKLADWSLPHKIQILKVAASLQHQHTWWALDFQLYNDK